MIFRSLFCKRWFYQHCSARTWHASDYVVLQCLDSLSRYHHRIGLEMDGIQYGILPSGMQNIEYSDLRSSKIDGASPLQTFFKITIPLLKPMILLTTITSTNGTLQLFDESLNLTKWRSWKIDHDHVLTIFTIRPLYRVQTSNMRQQCRS